MSYGKGVKKEGPKQILRNLLQLGGAQVRDERCHWAIREHTTDYLLPLRTSSDWTNQKQLVLRMTLVLGSYATKELGPEGTGFQHGKNACQEYLAA